MSLVKVGSRHEVIIPKAMCTKLQVKPGDYIELRISKGQAVLRPKTKIDRVPYTDEPIGPKTRASIRRGLKEVAEGKVAGPFRTAKELQAHLDSLKKRR